MQTNLSVGTVAITGTLKYLDSGALATDWGAGNFMALKFSTSDWTKFTSLKVGLNPSVSSGLVELINDPDKNGVFKVTDKTTQRFVIEAVTPIGESRKEYDLSALVTEDTPSGPALVLSQTELSLEVGTDPETVTISIENVDNPEDYTVTFESSSEAVVEVSEVADPETGEVFGYSFLANGEGTATVTFTATDGTDTLTAECAVTVTAPAEA